MSFDQSADDLKELLWEKFRGQHPNNFRRDFARELSKRWFITACCFSRSKVKIDPSKVRFGIIRDSFLFWPLGRIVIQRVENQKFRIVSRLSSERLFDEEEMRKFLKIFLFETEIQEFLISWGLMFERPFPNWVRDFILRSGDDGKQRDMIPSLANCVGDWLKHRVERYPDKEYYALTLVVATEIGRHSKGSCLKNYPELFGFDDQIPFDIENPDSFPPDTDDTRWLERLEDLVTVLRLTFWPPASEEIEIPLEM